MEKQENREMNDNGKKVTKNRKRKKKKVEKDKRKGSRFK